MSIFRRHPVSIVLFAGGLPIWVAFALAGLEALVIVVLVELLVVVVKGMWQ